MNIYRITIHNDDLSNSTYDRSADLILYTSENLADIKKVIENNLSVYTSRNDHDKANKDDGIPF